MTQKYAANLPRAGQGAPVYDEKLGFPVQKQITYTALGNGAVGTIDLFTVTGTVALKFFGKCTTTLTIQSGSTIEIGTALSTAALIAQTASDAPDVNEIWHDASPDASIELMSVLTRKIVSQDVIQTIANDTIDTGVILFMGFWYPMSEDGFVVPA